jgi:hypothetical protein
LSFRQVIEKEAAPEPFWSFISLVTAVGVVGAIVSGIRFVKNRKREAG